MARRGSRRAFCFLHTRRAFPSPRSPVACVDGAAVTITLLLFAAYADALGRSSMRLQMSPGATVSELLEQIREIEGAEQLPPSVLVAVNEEYATRDRVLEAGDEVALIPPVAGG